MGPYVSENFKTLLLPVMILFQPNFFLKSLWQSSQKLLIGILKFQILNFLKKIEIFVNMGSNGSGNFKMLLLLKLLFFSD